MLLSVLLLMICVLLHLQCNHRAKTSQPMNNLEIKITNLRFASLFVEICDKTL